MSDSVDFSPGKLQALLQAASQKLGATPEQLRQAAEDGQLDSLLQGASPQLRQALSDPQAAQKILSTPQAQKLLEALQKGQP